MPVGSPAVTRYLRGTLIASGCVAAGLLAARITGLATPPYVVLLGAVVGLSYGMLGVCLVLVFRSSQVINFAQPQIGVLAAALLGVLTTLGRLPFWLAFAVVVAAAGGLGALVYLVVVRRLDSAPRVVVVAATFGAGALLAAQVTGLQKAAGSPNAGPAGPGLPEFHLGPLLVTPDYTGLLIAGPVMVAALTWFLLRTRYGLAIRAATANPDAARLAGISPTRAAAVVWGLAGAVAAVTTVFFPAGVADAQRFAPAGLLYGLAAAALARMRSLPVALLAGTGIGVLDQVLRWNSPDSHLTGLVVFAVLVLALVFPRTGLGRGDQRGSWLTVAPWPPLPPPVARLWPVRHLGKILTALMLVALVLAGSLGDTTAMVLTTVLAAAIVALSLGVLTGLAGELSLGQFAIAALGAAASWFVVTRTGNFLLGLGSAALTAGAACVLLGLPALRSRGPMLAVTSLAFSIVVPPVLLTQPWLFGEAGVFSPQPVLAGVPLTPGIRYFGFTLVVFVLALVLVWNARRGVAGRALVATRDNEPAARSFAVPATRMRVQALFLSGALAGLGGAVLGHSQPILSATTFPIDWNIFVVLGIVAGGLSTVGGGVAGAFWVIGLPLLLPGRAGSGLTLAVACTTVLVIAMIRPGGAAQALRPVRDRLVALLARWYGVPPETPAKPEAPALPTHQVAVVTPARPISAQPPVLSARALHRSFGGVRAVDGVDLDVHRGEVLGLIGPNGAGKTTTFEMLSGFVRPDSGSVSFGGRDITRWAPERRALAGLVRSFQDGALFPTMSVLETVTLAVQRHQPSSTTLSVAGFERARRKRRTAAEAVVEQWGLGRYRSRLVQELSTGTRRIVELACMTTLQPQVLLLDEPSSGIAQRETEALGLRLRALREEFTLVVIEHNLPLITGLADRIVVLHHGRILCTGTPTLVCADDAVADAYLGGRLETRIPG
ncbi:ABC transporter permease subunit [Amycolatopsis jejuensis]|uniref:ABC transporter permease subunit n=1 Tax=Amycolatopsis jejuensis TaxID=330084 RepID=UPI00052672BD|nr:ATP-binding cassette domain-containing protein [Amycolatopsis jejuensis]